MSILDMIGPVMIGPSSSHTAGACRIGLLARAILQARPERAAITLHGSFAKTGRGHGTDRALVAGLLGMRPDDGRLPDALAEAERDGLLVIWSVADLGNVHPNSVLIALEGDGRQTTVLGSSLGGGAVEIVEIDGVPVRFSGARHTLLVGHDDFYGAIATVTRVVADDRVNIAALSSNREARGGEALMCLELDGRLSDEALAWIARIKGMKWIRMLPPVMDEG
jgi:L-serine dehydratase